MGSWQKLLFFSCAGMFVFLCGTGLLHAEKVTQWDMQGGGVITEGTVEYERSFCGGEDGYKKVLTVGNYTTQHWRDYASCSGNYDLNGKISFQTPPASIIGGEENQLTASGTMTGTRDCCFIGIWFKYGVSCENGSGYSITVDSSEKKVVEVWGSSGTTVNYSDDLDILLTLPGITSSATKCVITGYTDSGGNVKWTYYPTDVNVVDPPNTFIKAVDADYDAKKDEIILLVTLENTGGPDSGTIQVTGNISYYRFITAPYQARGYINTSLAYTMGEEKERVINIRIPVNFTKGDTSVKFPQACDEYPKGLLGAPKLTLQMRSESGGFTREKELTFIRTCSELNSESVLEMFMGPLSAIINKQKK